MHGLPEDLVQPPGRPSGLDLTAPLRRAYEHTRRVLFPFNVSKWLTLGFSAWIAHLGEGGGGSFSIPDTSGGRGRGFSQLADFVRDNLAVIGIVSGVVLVVALVITAALLFVSSRGKFIFLDNVLHNRTLVEDPWRRFREEGNSLFKVRLVLALITLVIILAAAGAFIGIAWDDLAAGVFEGRAVLGVVVSLGIVLLGVPISVLGALLEDFVLPTMYLDGPDWRAAAARVRSALSGQWLTVAAFYLLRIGLSVGAGVIAVLVTCFTCCIASLPFVGTVFMLPVIVFLRSYVWFFVQQLGPDFRLFPQPDHEVPMP